MKHMVIDAQWAKGRAFSPLQTALFDASHLIARNRMQVTML